MAKAKKSVFFCQNCGYESSKWLGQCPGCREWNSFVEETVSAGGKAAPAKGISGSEGRTGKKNEPVRLAEIQVREADRVSTNMEELDRVLGGGIVPGSMVLVGGDPGIGKSTLLLQVCRQLTIQGHKVLYISGEESLRQIKLRAKRIGEFNEHLYLLCETNLEIIRSTIERLKPEMVVIDSIQTMYNEEVSSAPGSVKNRFGSTNEIGVFEMREKGLEEVKNPSQALLNGRPTDASGTTVVCSVEGTRPILIEIQALVTRTNFGLPRRTSVGIDYNRVNLLMAVLEKRAGIRLGDCDAYVNLAGGMKLGEPAIDLGIVLSLVSSYKNQVIDEGTLIFGEVGLSGEVRGVSMAETRVREAEKLGFTTCIMPKTNVEGIQGKYKIKLIGVSNIKEAMEHI